MIFQTCNHASTIEQYMVDIHTVTIERPLITTYKSNLSVKSINFYCFVSMYVSLLFDGEYKSVEEEVTTETHAHNSKLILWTFPSKSLVIRAISMGCFLSSELLLQISNEVACNVSNDTFPQKYTHKTYFALM